MRKICPTCVVSYQPGPDAVSAIEAQAKESGQDIKIPKLLYKGNGCGECGMTGYRGRFGIYELLDVNDETKKIITAPDFSLSTLTSAARRSGMKSMFEDGMRKVELAQTSVEEVLRVIRE